MDTDSLKEVLKENRNSSHDSVGMVVTGLLEGVVEFEDLCFFVLNELNIH